MPNETAAPARSWTPGPIWSYAALLCLAVAPLATAIPLAVSAKRALNLTAFDPLIWLVGAWLVLAWWRAGRLRALAGQALRAAWPGLLLLGAGLLSALGTDFGRPQAAVLFAKALIQWAEYLVIGPIVFLTLWDGPRRRTALQVAAAALVAVLASVLLTLPRAAVHHQVGGLLGNRNTYGLYLLLALPLVSLLAGTRGEPLRRLPAAAWRHEGWPALLAVLGLWLCRAGGPVLGGVVAVVLTLWGLGRRAGAVLFLVVFLGISLRSGSGFASPWLVESVQVYAPFRDPETGARSREHTMRYYRWSANLSLTAEHPRLGVGLGQYQRRIGEYYAGVPRPEGRTDRPALYDIRADEPFTFGWFFLVAAETGLIGAACLLLLFADGGRRAVDRLRQGDAAGWAVLGVLAGLALAGWFTDAFVRGAGPMLAVVLGLAWSRSGGGGAAEAPATSTDQTSATEGVV